MPSLDEAYDRRWDGLRDPNRVGAGLVLAGIGGLAVLAAMVLVAARPESRGAKQAAGVAAGLGVPAMLLGVVVVLHASRRDRLGVLAGTALTVLGVGLFWFAYPDRWTRTADPMAFETLAVYAAGCAIGLWFVFSALASTRLRNVPHGTVELEVVREGETRTVEVSRDRYEDLVGDGGDAEAVLSALDETGSQDNGDQSSDAVQSGDTGQSGDAVQSGDTGQSGDAVQSGDTRQSSDAVQSGDTRQSSDAVQSGDTGQSDDAGGTEGRGGTPDRDNRDRNDTDTMDRL